MKTEIELRELDAWIAEKVMQMVRITDESFSNLITEHWINQDGSKLKKFKPTTDPAAAMMVLEKCAAKMKRGIVGIGSPMQRQGVASVLPRETQGWSVGKIGFPKNFDVEGETLPLAICLFAKQLFSEE